MPENQPPPPPRASEATRMAILDLCKENKWQMAKGAATSGCRDSLAPGHPYPHRRMGKRKLCPAHFRKERGPEGSNSEGD